MQDRSAEFRTGDTIRHNGRGSRYQILSRVFVRYDALFDGARITLGSPRQKDAVDAQCQVMVFGDDSLIRVMVQIDDKTKAAREYGDAFVYTSLDAPGQFFLRPVSEFTPDRFSPCGQPGALGDEVAKLMPQELFGLLADQDRVARGGDPEGSRLHALALAYVGETGFQPGRGPEELMAQLAAAADEHLGGSGKQLPVTLDPVATEAVMEIARLQDLSPDKVVLQALRLYMQQVLGVDTTPGPGCMGD